MADRFPVDVGTLRDWMARYVAGVLAPEDGVVPTDRNFDTYGFDSVEAVVMAGVMEEEFCVPVDPVQLFEHPSIDAFAAAHASEGEVIATTAHDAM
jgi:acyl carrier protein